MIKVNIGIILTIIATLSMTGSAAAQTFPNKPVHLVLPFAPGGGADTQARIIVQKLSEFWGQPVVIDNKPGAGTTIAAGFVAKSAPDGYTLYSGYPSHVISANLYKNLPYDALKSFTPIVLTTDAPFTLVVLPSSRARTVRELVELAKTSPKKLNYGSSGIGAGPHVSGELFKSSAQIDAIHIPYKGTGDVIPAILGGQFDYTFADPAVRPSLAAGKLRALAVTSARRWTLLPDVPTMAEAGVPGVEVTSWTVIFAPAGSPGAIVNQINAAYLKALSLPDVREKFANNGYDIIGGTPDEAARHLATEFAKYAKVVKDLGLKVE